MKFTTSFSLAALFASLVASADVPQSQIDFFTALVGDYQDHKTEYIRYFATAQDVPDQLKTIATQVLTYTDDSYTTLLENESLNVPELESYATELPWYSRLEEAAGGDASGAASASETGSGSGSASATRSGSASGSATSNAASASESGSSSATSSASATTTSAAGNANGIIAPVGAALGALAVALM
ncbi:hypothetical protein Cantr_09460 [Candida viswanathii]|uniref:Temperature shock-inducible protein 1 n=1 Tax=Candida viswanathii TaxID=5486 RepID=A0A367YAI5_9ASCO|nr:hypothetical protein Cantr_09460 [Candida viswanathii]